MRPPAIAARAWLAKHKVIFRLDSVSGLRVYADSRLAASGSHAVTFQQALGGLKVVNGTGFITVAVRPGKANRWKIGFVSSTAIGSVPLKGTRKLTAAQGWVHGASSIGLKTALVNVRSAKAGRGWTNLRVGGLQNVQRVRLGAFATARRAVPAFETIVLDTSSAVPAAYRVIVNARTGAILARTNLTDYFSTAKSRAKQPLAVTTTPFDGEVPGTDAACDVRKGPFTVGPGVRALSGFAAATVSNNDIVFKLFFDGSTTPLITADTGTSPEAFRFAPAGGVPPGDYFVQVCDFEDGAAWATPRTYTGTVTIAPDVLLAPGCRLRDRRRQPCVALAVGLRRAGERDDVHDERQQQQGRDLVDERPAPSPPQFMPVSNPNRDYTYTWSNEWNTRLCQRAAVETPGSTYDDAAATANLFAVHNRMHDFSYYLGFTEQNFNAQSGNFGLTETWQEGDPLIGDVQSGSNRARATTRTWPRCPTVSLRSRTCSCGSPSRARSTRPAWTVTTTTA